VIISVVAAKIWYLKMCGFYWATLYINVHYNCVARDVMEIIAVRERVNEWCILDNGTF